MPKPTLSALLATIQNSVERYWLLFGLHHQAFLIPSRVRPVNVFWKSASVNMDSAVGFIAKKTTIVRAAQIFFSVHSYFPKPPLSFEHLVVLHYLIQDFLKAV